MYQRASAALLLGVIGLAFRSALSSPQATPSENRSKDYSWLTDGPVHSTIKSRLAPPENFARVTVGPASFGSWLRGLPLRPSGDPVRLFDGKAKSDQSGCAAVIDIDVGKRDLQQCADFVIRMRAEYLFAMARLDEIQFHFTSGDLAEFSRWASGERPLVTGNRVAWKRIAKADDSYAAFGEYLQSIFTYAGTRSLAAEMNKVNVAQPIEIGDVFVQPGSPGHAVLVVDVAVQPQNGRRVFLLAQSFMPAQSPHVLHNPGDPALDPWYSAEFTELRTPDWRFKPEDRRRFATR